MPSLRLTRRLPAIVKRRGLRQVSVELRESDAATLETLRVKHGLRSWGAVVRMLIEKEKP